MKVFRFTLILFVMLMTTGMMAQQLAFPSAEGYGKYTVGGRGGKVYEVTNLNDSGEGSLRAAVEAEGPRTVVFRVSGTIALKRPLRISHPYITIAGQTAPGDGICIKDYPLSINADEVIIRYIRCRLGDETKTESDALSCRRQKHIMLDHLSVSWSIDEAMSIYDCEHSTVQWCMITESLSGSNHTKGSHGFGGIWGINYGTFHHNLIAHHSSRNPRFSGGCGYNDYRNNVIYNWGYNSCYGGEGTNKQKEGLFYINMVANYYKAGPASAPGTHSRIANPSYKENAVGKWFVDQNYVYGYPEVTADNWNGGIKSARWQEHKADQPWDAMPIRQHTAEEAFVLVTEKAGASLPKRDAIDARIVEEVRNGNATFEGKTYKTKRAVVDKTVICGIIDSQNDVGGWPELKSLPAPVDSDHDGMPDEWEISMNLNPANSADGVQTAQNGYTNLENYLNHLAGE